MFISDFKKAMSSTSFAIALNHWRNYYLALLAISTSLVTIYALVNPAAGNHPVANFKFPQRIKLNLGKLVALPTSTDTQSNRDRQQTTELESEIVKTKQEYQYIQDDLNINLEISYLVNTRGDIESYLKQYTNIASKAIANKQIAEIEAIGYHALFRDRDRAYLSSCVSPRSPSNVTQKQFSTYRYQNDLTLQIGWEWLQGKSSIRDRRCLWINMSTPLIGDSQTAYKTLETAWQEIYPWLSLNFPAL